MELCPGRKSIVFAPHPDDETLGCAGLIARKIRAGEEVYIVVMTDGSHSHSHLIDRDSLIAMRESEFRNASEILGVKNDNIVFLRYEDAKLSDHLHDAEIKINDIINKIKPEEVYTTYKHESPSDHKVTNHIINACAKNFPEMKVYEYPIWFFAQWPFVVPVLRGRSEIPKKLLDTIISNMQLLSDMKYAINIKDVLDVKEKAIQAYESQTLRHNNEERWAILSDISNGEFLKCFLAEFEVFYRSR